jgi:pilus assembly protein Flp/PilA
MKTTRPTGDRGASLIEYALVVTLIAVASLYAVANVGSSVSDTFSEVGDSVVASDAPQENLTPDEIWQQAKDDYDQAVDDAKARKQSDLAQAKSEYQSQLATNKSLPKAQKNAANKQAKSEYNSAKTQANDTYKSAVASAKVDLNTAKATWKASK